ncbi:MAG: hypothetical protein GF365_04695 [Candidatus Buchananbacteria bacterium]|nr:hypothetical protein [Candidatus Buchananbacteria bacterium]
MIEKKFVCPFCGFESNGPGLCPTCDETLNKVCNCGSGKFAAECCGADDDDTSDEELIKAEVTTETLSEIVQEDQKKLEEEEELANVEEVKDED